ncbi:SDR family oxidoreductase [Amycolatopsis sp. lyj-90]|uniref:SDR family oxidoreductase n=1 Tax=Amycolatopsis sp. lyj-90 TaxID=2789285 RepID=UPI00397CE81F
MSSGFEGKIALVTGGTKGVGRAIALELGRRGAHVIANWFHSEKDAEDTVRLIRGAGGSAEQLRASVAKHDSVERMFTAIARKHGRLDILINSAARGVFEPTEVLTDRDWERVLDTNLHGPRWCARAALPLLPKPGGVIVNVSSVGNRVVIDNYTSVAVSKAGLESLTRYLAVEFGKYGIRVNAAAARMLAGATVGLFPGSESMLEAVAAGTPLGRIGTAEEFAGLVAFLASEDAGWVTGEVVLADGGNSLGGALARAGGTWGPAHRQEAADRGGRSEQVSSPQDSDDAVAIVGMGIMVPGADSPERFWKLLLGGEPTFSEPGDRYPQEHFWAADPGEQDRTYAAKAGYLGKSDEPDFAGGWLRQAIRQALPASFDSERAELVIGACADGNQHLEQALVVEGLSRRLAFNWASQDHSDPEELHDRLREALRAHYRMDDGDPSSHLPDGVVRNAIAGLLPTSTPYTVIDTACSSSLYALDLGAKKLLAGECDLALCGGVYMVTPRFNVLFGKLNGLSRRDDLRAFDRSADGTMFSDGSAMVALRRLSDARRRGDRILGVLAGFGAAADGKGKAIYAPNPRGQELALRRAFEINDLSKSDVGWVVAHGTGTPVGDEVELQTLNTVFDGTEVVCTSSKSLVGHTGWSSGVVSVIHALLGLRHGVVPAQYGTTDPLPHAIGASVRVPAEDTALRQPVKGRQVVGVSAFGFGGTNAHQLIEGAASDARAPRCQPPQLVDEIVLVAWSAHLPGAPSSADIRDRLRKGEAPSEATSFGSPMPLPGPRALGMPPATAAALDRTQIMALAVAERFIAENGTLWTGIEDKTGVVAAHYGPVLAWAEASLRCYADDLLTVAAGDHLDPAEFAKAANACVAQIRSEVHPTTPDTQPGLMSNVIPARIANRYDLNGPVLLADTGASSSLAAIDIASRYLRSGQMNLALVLALHGDSSPDLAALLGQDGLAEGAFLLAFARRSDAMREGWPVLCDVSTSPPDDTRQETAPSRSRSYLAADGIVDLLTQLERISHGGAAVVTGQFPAPQVGLKTTATAAHNRRYVSCLVEEPIALAPAVPATPGDDWLVIVQRGCEGALPRELAASGAEVLVVDGLRPREDQFATSGPFRHVRVIGSLDTDTWPGPPAPDVLALHELLFLAARAYRDQLETGGSLGVHLSDPLRGGVPHPHSGLFTGTMKSLAWDLQGSLSAVVLSDSGGTETWGRLHDELRQHRGDPLSVYRGGIRQRYRLAEVPVSVEEDADPLRPGAVVVATGGARGITAACVEELARRVPLRVWLLGSSQLDDVPDDILRANEPELPALRAAYLRERRAMKSSATVPQLSAQFDRLLRARESLLTLRRLRHSCGADAVRYVTCDVTDAADVRRVANEIAGVERSIDLLIHGAGLHGGGDISRLTLEGLRKIRDVKVAGYHNLRAAFVDPAPRRWCSFGSVSGLVGLPGESDYAPGNDFLTSAARYSAHVEGRDEQGIGWPIWSETGMGSSELVQAHNARTGLMAPLSTAEGVRHFAHEIAAHRTTEPVVSFLHQIELEKFGTQFPGLFLTADDAPPSFLLDTPYLRTPRHARWTLDMTAERTGWLEQHLVKGTPTVPGAVLAAVAAEAAIQLRPRLVPVELRSLRFSSFVRPHAGDSRRPSSPFQVDASMVGEDEIHVVISSDVTGPGGQLLRTGREHFSGTVVLGTVETDQVTRVPSVGAEVSDPYYLEGAAVHLDGMFHATDAWLAGPSGSSARWRLPQASRPDERFLAQRSPIPVILIDSLLRTGVLCADESGRQVVKVPRAVEKVELRVAGSDQLIARDHPTITLHHHAEDGIDEAVSGNEVLLRVSGCELISLSGTPTAVSPRTMPTAKTITAAVAEKAGAEFVIREVELDLPRAEEVRIRVEASGICHTDLLVRDQIYPPGLPAVLGHEGAGVVEEVGSAVRGIEPGDHVVVSYASCGDCTHCLRGSSWCDQFLQLNLGGSRPDGSSPISLNGEQLSAHFFGQSSFATHLVTSVRNVVRIPKDVPFKVAAPMGCAVQTGAGAVLNALRPPANSSMVVFGAGSVGLSAIMAARAVGCSPIIAVNRRQDRLELASELGATHLIDGNASDIVEQVLAITGGGADYTLESTGDQKVIASAVRALKMGGVCGLLTVAPPGVEVGIDLSHLLFGRTIKGILEGDLLPQLLIPQLVDLYVKGLLPVDRLVRTYRLDEINRAVSDARTGTTIKPVLLPSG